MDGSRRNRSQSVPILSQIEKILDHEEEDCVVERRTSDGFSRFPETRSSRRNITRARLSSGGLIRKHKKRHSRAGMESTQIGSAINELQSEEEEVRPRAFTTSAIEANTADTIDHIPTGKETLQDQVRDTEVTEDPRPTVPVRRKRCKSLPSVIPVEDLNVGNNKAKEIGCETINREQTVTSEGFCREEKKLFRRRRFSLPARLQHEDSEKVSHSVMTALTESFCVDSTDINKPVSLITEFDKLSIIKFKRGEEDLAEFFSHLSRRRRSLPCYLEHGGVSTEPTVESTNFSDGSQKTRKIKTQRSQSLPLSSSRCVGEVSHYFKEECSISDANWCDSEYSFRQPLEQNRKSTKKSRKRKKSRKTRSKSLPLVLDEETKANMSVNSTKHTKQTSLQSHDTLHDTKRANSLPFIYESYSAESELLPEAEITQIQPHVSDTEEKERTVSINKAKQVHGDGNIKLKAQLGRARSFPLRGPATQHKQISDIREDLNKAIDIFFSQNDDKDDNVVPRERSQSLPTVLEGKHSLNFAPIEKILEEKRNIPEIVIAEGNLNDTVGDEKCESVQSPAWEEEKITNEEECNSDAGSDCDELESQISHSTYIHDPPIVPRPRGFSIPSSFKMEKIPEEPNENEMAIISRCELCGAQGETNCVCKDRLVEIIDCTQAANHLIGSQEESGQVSHHEQSLEHDQESLAEDETEPNDYQKNLEKFYKMVTQSYSRTQQLEFAKSSSCLHRAAALGDLEHVKLLVEEGNDVNALDESGWPVLHAAVTTGNFDCCAWLVDSGADLITYSDFVIDEYRMLCQQVYLY